MQKISVLVEKIESRREAYVSNIKESKSEGLVQGSVQTEIKSSSKKRVIMPQM